MQSWPLLLFGLFLLLTLINYRWGLYISLFSITGYLLFPHFAGGPPFLWHEPLVPFVFVMFLYAKREKMEPILALNPHLNPLLYATGLFLLVLIGQYFRNPVLTSRLGGGGGGFLFFYRFIIDFLLMILVAEESQTPEGRRRLFWAILASTLTTVVIGVLAYYIPSFYLLLDRLGFTGVKAWRISIDPKSGVVRFLMLQIPSFFGLILVLLNPLGFKVRYQVPLALFFAFSLMLSGGRAVFWGTMAAFLTLVLYRYRRQMLFVVAVLITFSIGLTVANLQPEIIPPAYRRVFQIIGTEKELSAVRFYVHRLMLKQIAQHPLFGVGFKPDVFIPEFIPREAASEFVLKNLAGGGHGSYYSLLYFFGLVGLLPYLYAIWRALRVLLGFIRHQDPEVRQLGLLYLAWFIPILAMYYAFYRGEAPHLFFLYGLITGLALELRQREEEAEAPAALTARWAVQ